MSARHLAARLAAAVALALTASGCGSAESAEQPTGPSTVYDRALHDALPADVRGSGVVRVATDAS